MRACDRVHTSPDSSGFLLKVDESQLCYSCHGGVGAGATTNVQFGYAKDDKSAVGDGKNPGARAVGALRGGGFDQSWIGSDKAARPMTLVTGTSALDPSVYGTVEATAGDGGNYSAATGNTVTAAGRANLTKLVPPATSGADTTSAHSVGTVATVWGNGTFGSSVGKAGVDLECSSCHDPHGNGNYRILKPVPSDSGVSGATFSIAGYTAGAGGTTGSITYTTTAAHGFVVGQSVVIKGLATQLSGPQVVTVVPSTTSFTVASRYVTAAGGAGGTVTGSVAIADSTLGSQVYTTANYWKADTADTGKAVQDVSYLGQTVQAGQSAFIANISAWCSTCHTRYAAPSGSRSVGNTAVGNGESTFMYRHTSNENYDTVVTNTSYGTAAAPSTPGQRKSCIQCHVAHGSSASMSGEAAGAPGQAGQNPDGTANATPGKLLRIDGRGTCRMCHAAQGNS